MLFRGLRARVGIYTGSIDRVTPHVRTGRAGETLWIGCAKQVRIDRVTPHVLTRRAGENLHPMSSGVHMRVGRRLLCQASEGR